MAFNASLAGNAFRNAALSFAGLRTKTIKKSMKTALNRAIKSYRNQVGIKVRERINVKRSELNQKFIFVNKFRGSVSSPLSAFEASLKINGRPLGMARFVKGAKETPKPKQKGIKVSKRKAIKVEVRKGRTSTRPTAFLLRGRGGNLMLARRSKPGTPSKAVTRQAIPGIARFVEKPEMQAPLQRFAQQRLAIEYQRAFDENFRKLSKVK